MREYVIDVEHNLHFEIAGYFISPEVWSHMHRQMPFYNLIYVTKGTFTLDEAGEKYIIQAGDIFIMDKDIEHKGLQPSNASVEYFWTHFTAHARKKPVDYPFSLNPDHAYLVSKFQPKHPEKIKFLFNQLIDSFCVSQYTPNVCNSFLKLLLYELSTQYLDIDHTDDTNRRFNYIIEWLRLNASQNITLDFLAEKFLYNKTHLARMFKNKTGKTVIAFITEERMRNARHYLTNTDVLIKQISSIIGYPDEKYFMRIFKKYHHMTPSEYRNAYSKTVFNDF